MRCPSIVLLVAVLAACPTSKETGQPEDPVDTGSETGAETGTGETGIVPQSPCPLYVDAAATPGGDGSEASPITSITEAIEASWSGCPTITVLPGTYVENVVFGGRDVMVTSREGPEVTIIEPREGGSVVRFADREGTGAGLSGFTLRGGTGTPGGDTPLDDDLAHGGGLYADTTRASITDCILEDNVTTGKGAGAFLYHFEGVFSGNTVRGNLITEAEDYGGAGLYVYDAEALISDNVIEDNVHDGLSGDGGGLLVYRGAPTLVRNVIRGNEADSFGGGLRVIDSSSYLANNLIVGNDPDGITFSNDDASIFVHNTVADSAGDGLRTWTSQDTYEGDGPTVALVNNIIADSGRFGVYVSGAASFTAIWNNDVWGSADGEWAGWTDPTGTQGNLCADPEFVGGDHYGLQATSPLVDAGLDASDWGVTDDIEGNARPEGRGYDVGAYESY